jgi:hypothetical protein
MKKLILIIFFLLAFSIQKITAQYYFYNKDYYDTPVIYELGGSIGLMNCLTDLGGKKGTGKKFIKDVNFKNTQLAGSIFLNAMYKNAVAIRIEGVFGQIKAYDSILSKVKETAFGRYERNLSFRSNITEFTAAIEIHPLFIFNKYTAADKLPAFSPYLLAGVGIFSFNPQAKLSNNWINLQPLSTEGQGFTEYPNRKPYKLQQLCFPAGVGIKYELSPMVNLRAECIYRILSTDYLDDVSTNYINSNLFSNYFTGAQLNNALLLNDRQYELNPTHITNDYDERGHSYNNDAYFTFNLKIGLVLGREKIKKH